jgi:2-keto-4-pentenoate hydratase
MLDERIRRGMARQLEQRRRSIEAGEQPLGWKVGFGAPQAMRDLGIDRPLVGHLLKSAVVDSDHKFSFPAFAKIALEPEIAVYLGTDIDNGADSSAVKAAISGLGPAIEVADVTFPPSEGPETILAGNVYQRAVILGEVDKRRGGAELAGLAATVSVNGVGVDVPEDLEANTGPIVEVVAMVADTLAAMGERLSAGELVIVGSIVPPLFPEAATSLTYTLGEAAPMSVSVA